MRRPFPAWPLLLALLAASPALAQTTPAPADTARLRYAEEVADPTQVAPPPRQERRGQWKLGLNNFLVNGYPFSATRDRPGYYTRYGLHLAYERRLGRAWTGQLELSPALTHYRPEGTAGSPEAGVQLRAQLAGRYYYNLERRLRRGHRTEGFSANYFALALGLGLSNGPSETPFHLLDTGTGPATDAALLYGLQRRLGRYGFVDASVGLSGVLQAGQWQKVGPVVSLRLGLALPVIARTAPQEAPPDEVNTLLPRFFGGVQFGDGHYYAHYSYANPYPASYQTTAGGYTKTVDYPNYVPNVDAPAMGRTEYYNDRTWYGYGGYYLRPRLALQLGVQVGASTYTNGGIGLAWVEEPGQRGRALYPQRLDETLLAVPVQVRYALTRSFRQRLQLEVVGGLTLVRTGVHFREFGTAGYDLTDEVVHEFSRQSGTVAANLGGALSYGLGPRRRLQFTLEYGLLQDLRGLLSNPAGVTDNAKIGLRYRFGYR